MAEGILDFMADGRDAQDNVSAHHGARDRDPAERFPQLKREHDHVYPRDLADGDGVGDGERCVENAFGPREHFVEGRDIGHDHSLMHAVAECAILRDRLHVRREIA